MNKERIYNLFICAVVHKHNVIFSCHFHEVLSMLPLIFSLVKEPVEKKEPYPTYSSLIKKKKKHFFSFSFASFYFFLKIFLAWFKSAPHLVRLFWPTFPTEQEPEKKTNQHQFSLSKRYIGRNGHTLTSPPPKPHTVKFWFIILQQLHQVVFVIIKLKICLENQSEWESNSDEWSL